MKKNVGQTDKIIRILLAVAIAALYYFTDLITGTLGLVLIIVAIILLLTSLVNFCPLYRLFGISTCKIKQS